MSFEPKFMTSLPYRYRGPVQNKRLWRQFHLRTIFGILASGWLLFIRQYELWNSLMWYVRCIVFKSSFIFSCNLLNDLFCSCTETFDECRPLPDKTEGHCLEPHQYGKCCEFHKICDGYICPDGQLSTLRTRSYGNKYLLPDYWYWITQFMFCYTQAL